MVAQLNGSNVTAIVKHEESAPVRAEVLPSMSWAEMIDMGTQIHRSGILPEHVKNGAHAAAIILTGRELGMGPMRSLRSLQVVKGKVVESADSQLSRFKADGGHAKFLQLDETKAVIFLRHPNGDEHTETWTIDDAKKAGLLSPSRNGEPSMHTKYPKSMNRSRVITMGLKSLGWEGGVGAYDPEEAHAFTATVRDDDHADPPPAAPTIASVQMLARAELDRLLVGYGIPEDDAKLMRTNAVKRINDGKRPQTIEDWSAVLAKLKEEPTPESAPSEPDADDDTTSTKGA